MHQSDYAKWVRDFPLEILFFMASLSLLLVPSVPPFRGLESVSGWIKPYYYVNYFDLGLIKRGLVGTIYFILGIPGWTDQPEIVVVASHILVSIATASLFWLFAGQQLQGWSVANKLPLYVVFLLSPAFFVRLGFDTGRMDLWCFAISIATLIALFNDDLSVRSAALISGFSMSVQLLIHDASILFYSPLILGTFLLRKVLSPVEGGEEKRFRVAAVLTAIVLPVVVGMMLLVWGKYEPGPEALDQALIRLNPGLAGGMSMELTWTLKRAIRNVWSGLTLWGFLGGHLLIISYYLLSVSLVIFLARAPLWMCATAFTPLAVSFLATDSLRFLGVSVMSFFLLVLVAAGNGEIKKVPDALRMPVYLMAAFFFVFGPWSCCSGDPLPLLKYVPWRI